VSTPWRAPGQDARHHAVLKAVRQESAFLEGNRELVRFDVNGGQKRGERNDGSAGFDGANDEDVFDAVRIHGFYRRPLIGKNGTLPAGVFEPALMGEHRAFPAGVFEPALLMEIVRPYPAKAR